MSRVLLLIVCAVSFGALRPVHGEIIRLKSGDLVHGEIEAFDEAVGITVLRADTGGTLSLRWDHLPPDEVRRIKAGFGFTGEEPEPYLVNVVHLVLRNGTTASGVLVDGGPSDSYSLRRRSGVERFPKSFVKLVETGKAEGLEIYEPDELYKIIVDDLGGTPVDALGNFNLAVACEGAGLYENAREHYAAAQRLDPTLKSELIPARLQRIAIKIEDAAETAVLDEIKNLLYRKKFEDALAQVDAFRAEYPQSRQLNELSGLEGKIRQAKREFHATEIVSDYFAKLDKRIQAVARDDGVTLDMAEELAEQEIHPAILAELSEAYSLGEETVQDLWDARRGGSPRSAFYGSGTFILGKQRALEFGRFDDEADDALPGLGDEAPDADDTHGDIVEKIKKQRAAKAAERQRSSRGSALADEGPTPDEWWDAAPREDRVKWLLAYYAESSGQLKVLEARGRNCRQCDALGYVEVTNEDGEIERQTCPTCKGLAYERLVKFR
ncbi:MAG: hypothetical protein H6825_14510 [Planctomycetes bacterium]|nr:hypothetical protein [Planctomycetota bacterium]